MDNNDILIRLRQALDLNNTDVREIFKLGGTELTEAEVGKILKEKEEIIKCENSALESFLNGFIIFKRGKQDPQPGQTEKPVLSIKGSKNLNNIMLKKLKIALSLSSEDMLNVFTQAGVVVTKGELSDFFRKEGHKHYKECGDKYAMNFLKGLAAKKRNTDS